ncbi:HD domain-containing protein [Candidatus Bipolaricaulota bacterium]
MNRLERVRKIVDGLLRQVSNPEDARCGFVHLYGVSATATLLARIRGLDEEIAGVAGMLHDLATYETDDPHNHGPRSAARAGQILQEMGKFSEEEIQCVQSAISHHSDKSSVQGAYEELLKDADVLQHDLYNPALDPDPRHEERRSRLRQSLD